MVVPWCDQRPSASVSVYLRLLMTFPHSAAGGRPRYSTAFTSTSSMKTRTPTVSIQIFMLAF